MVYGLSGALFSGLLSTTRKLQRLICEEPCGCDKRHSSVPL